MNRLTLIRWEYLLELIGIIAPNSIEDLFRVVMSVQEPISQLFPSHRADDKYFQSMVLDALQQHVVDVLIPESVSDDEKFLPATPDSIAEKIEIPFQQRLRIDKFRFVFPDDQPMRAVRGVPAV